MNVCNFFKYLRYGVFSSNDFYTPQDTLKVGSLMLCLLSGQLLFLGLLSFFYANSLSIVNGINPAMNTGLLSLIYLVLLAANYMGFSGRIAMSQVIGSFLTLVGVACTFMTIEYPSSAFDDTANSNQS